jgi:hypothetical protein
MAKYIPGRNYIGSSEIATDLDVTGPATFSDTVTISGDVAIGTTSPEEILHIQKTDNDARIQIITSTARSSTIFFGDTDDRNAGIIEYDNNGDFMRFFANASERMRLTSDGNLLLGTTTDNGQKLQVNGGITLADNSFLTWKNSNTRIVGQSGYMVFQVAATDKMKINSNGNVLIGTTTDSGAYRLDVSGKARVQSVLELDDVLTLNAISTPADPASGKSSIYMDSADGAIKVKINVGGTVVTRTIASYE